MLPVFRLLRIGLVVIWLIALASAAPQLAGLAKVAVAPPVVSSWRGLAQAVLFFPLLILLSVAWEQSKATRITDALLLMAAIAYAYFPAPFFDYIWDVFLIETTFVFLLSQVLQQNPRTKRWALWPLRLLLFRLMFSMGVIKFFGGMPEWRDGTAMVYFWANQPMPGYLAWHAAQLPLAWQQAMGFFVFLAETPGPLLIFCGRRARVVFFLLNLILQLGIFVSGNYGFFNLLTIVLCISLFEEREAQNALSSSANFRMPLQRGRTLALRVAQNFLFVVLFGWLICSAYYQYAVFRTDTQHLPETSWVFLQNREQREMPAPLMRLLQSYAAAKIANPYALFGHIAKYRMEIEIWGSHDAASWKKYRFRVKPDEITRAPIWYAPHHWRLDHQFYYESFRLRAPQIAAQYSFFLGSRWLPNFARALFQNDAGVLSLLRQNPFAEKPSRYLRFAYLYYAFTNKTEHKATAAYWKTEPPHPGQFFDQPFTAEELDRIR